MKVVLDITRLVAEGQLTAEDAARLKKLAAVETGSLAINILLALGVVAVAGGILALNPATMTALTLGTALAGGGFVIRANWPDKWGFLGSASVLVGTLTLAGGVVMLFDGAFGGFLFATVLMLGAGIAVRSGLLVGLSALSVASLLGSSTGYWHASYMLVVREGTLTIVVFSLLALIAFQMSKVLEPALERLALVFSRMSLVMVNFGFWVGSLWGDYPGESWIRSEMYRTASSPWRMMSQWRADALFIPDVAFAIVWAIALLAVGAWGARVNRRFVVNTAATFGAIHFYTQWFEALGAAPWAVICAGMATIAFAIGLWRYNKGAGHRFA